MHGRLTLAIALAALVLAPMSAVAQDRAIRLGTALRPTTEPLEVTADRLDVDQQANASVFEGEVLVVQGEMRLTAQRLRIEFQDLPEGGRRVERLLASGGVTVVTPEEAIEAREAVYHLPSGGLEMTGDVMLVQGENILTGQRFVADMVAGTGTMSGRVRTIIRMD